MQAFEFGVTSGGDYVSFNIDLSELNFSNRNLNEFKSV